jgi:glycosyltransferase involved in cell wall biosynthesis
MEISLVSGGDRVYLRSHVNHRIYSQLMGWTYRHETGPFDGLRSPYYFKLAAVQALLPSADWVIWLDDDAYVTDFEGRDLAQLLESAAAEGFSMVIADSPRSADGRWTAINSGVFALRNTPESAELLRAAMSVTTDEVRNWWNDDEYGYFTNGDQDSLYWAIKTQGFDSRVMIVSHDRINARPGMYQKTGSEHFICHFPGARDKKAAIGELAARLGRDVTLVPAEVQRRYDLRPGRIPTATSIRLGLLGRKAQSKARGALARLRRARRRAR